LKLYVRPRLVVLNPNTPVLGAARALENNNIGAVVVQREGQVVGIVTDRDLTVRVVGRARDPRTTPLSEVMTTPVVTLSPSDDQAEAIRLMEDYNVRRIPLVDDGRLVGIVTLDDLLLDEAAPLDRLASVVEAQIGEGGPAGPVRSPARERRAARAEATFARLVKRLQAEAALESPERAEAALETVLGKIVQRLTPEEAKDLIAQLPSLLQPRLRQLPPGPDKSITRETIEADLAGRLGVDRARAASIMVAVWDTVAQTVSRGQMEDVYRQLPEELRRAFPAPYPGKAAS
ncbi:MAG TPA: CBS domain-containing protein, partial [Thermodesulfobacteriota bacterium]